MCKSLLRRLGVATDSAERDHYDPIYGLPKRSLEAWLLLNPQIKKQYEAELKTKATASTRESG